MFKRNKIFIGLILASIVVALIIGFNRHQAEVVSNQVEIAVDYEDLTGLAAEQGVDRYDLLRKLKDAGVTSVGVTEETLEHMNEAGEIAVLKGYEVLNVYRALGSTTSEIQELLLGGVVNPNAVYIITDNRDRYGWLTKNLTARYGAERVHSLSLPAQAVLPKYVIELEASSDQLLKQGVGLPLEDLAKIQQLGLKIMPRFSNYPALDASGIDDMFAQIDAFRDNITSVVFAGEEVVGYPNRNLLSVVAQNLQARNYPLGLIENPLQLGVDKQKGSVDLAPMVDYRAVRVYSIDRKELDKLTVADAADRYVRAAKERNIRIAYLRPFLVKQVTAVEQSGGLVNTYENLVETNIKYAKMVHDGLEQAGFAVGPAKPFVSYHPPKLLLVIIAFGVVAAGILLLNAITPLRQTVNYLLLVLGCLGSAGMLMINSLSLLALQALALTGGIIFATLGLAWQLERWKEVEPKEENSYAALAKKGIATLVVTSLFALVGGLFVGTFLSDIRFLLDVSYFRGVKALHIIPIALVGLVYLSLYGLDPDRDENLPFWEKFVRFGQVEIRIKHVALLLLAVVIGYIYIARTGNTSGLPVSEAEIRFRNFLENTLYARPRTKEFLFAHPALMLTAWAVYTRRYRKYVAPLALIGVIGQLSMVDSFAHLRTPIFMSLMRGVNGLVLGIVVGLVALLLVKWGFRYLEKWQQRSKAS